MKILLTGSTGFLGKKIMNILGEEEIITLSRTKGDIIADLKSQVPDLPPVDLVIHCAGHAHLVSGNKSNDTDFFDINVSGTKNLLKGISASGSIPGRFLLMSSVSVYGRESGILIGEDETLLATDPYGVSKIQAEIIVKEWCYRNDVICTILRLPLIAGSTPPGNLQAMIKAIKYGYYFNVAGGKAKRSMVLATDVAKFIPIVSRIGGVYNLTDGYHPSFKEISRLIADQTNRPAPLNLSKSVATIIAKVGDLIGANAPLTSIKLGKMLSNLTFDDNKARNSVGWDPLPVLSGFKISE